MQKADIYIDTSIKGPKRRSGKYVYIVGLQDGERYRDSKPQIGSSEDATENQLTLEALENVLNHLKKPFFLHIYLECPYVAAVLENRWYKDWHKKDWKNAKGKPVADAEKWRNIEYLLDAHEFEVHLKQMHSYKDWMHWMIAE